MFEQVINATLIVGVVANLLTLADFVVRPHQARWLQSKFERLLGVLNHMRPLLWARRASELNRANTLAIVGVIPVALAISVLGIAAGLALTSLLAIALAYGAIRLMWLISNRIVGWLVGDSHPALLGLRAVCILACLGISIAGAIASVSSYDALIVKDPHADISNSAEFTMRWLLVVTVVPGAIIVSAALLPAIAILCVVAVSATSELLVMFLRGIVVRVVEYNKGAVAALVLLATVVVGIVRLCLIGATP